MRSDEATQLAPYFAAIHLRTPDVIGYDHSDQMRIESVNGALQVDSLVEKVWPRRATALGDHCL